MSEIKKLASQTVLYGLSSIVPRFLNYLLVPFYTRVFINPAEYGVITELYTYITFLLIILTMGFETSFFRFYNEATDKKKLFSTAFFAMLFSSAVFAVLLLFNLHSVASTLGYLNNIDYLVYFIFIIVSDILLAIPFCKLRAENRPLIFAFYRILNVLIQLVLNIYFLLISPLYFHTAVDIKYVFISNLIANCFSFLLLLSSTGKLSFSIDVNMLKKMFTYGWPLMIAGLIGNVNEALDRVLIKFRVSEGMDPMTQLGIYGASIKIAVLLVLFNQMFRYAFEPFIFKQGKNERSPQLFADILLYFTIFSSFIALGILLYPDIIKHFIGSSYWEGLKVVPILVYGYVFYGILLNQSIWYKLNDKTRYGIIITVIGAAVTILINYFGIPYFGYVASAWGHLTCYVVMVVVSYFMGQAIYPIPYKVTSILLVIGLSLLLYGISQLIPIESFLLKLIFNTFLLIVYVGIIEYKFKLRKLIFG